MSRIQSCLAELKKSDQKALIPYIVCGDPNLQSTVPIMHALVAGGANIIELGVPFSDPMAEGPVIQQAHERALDNQVSLSQIFACVAEFRQADKDTPIVLMGYANPIEKMGYAEFAKLARAAGADGVLTVDLPHEEAAALGEELRACSIDNIFLLTPTTTEQRAKNICQLASGYLYYVSLKGVTGAGNLDIAQVQTNYERLNAYTALPICVGFGIKDAQSAAQISRFASGVVIGSALIKQLNSEKKANCEQLAALAERWLSPFRKAMDNSNTE